MGIESVKTKGVEIELDRTRHLRYTFAGLGYLAEKYGSVIRALQRFDAARGLGVDVEAPGITDLSLDTVNLIVDMAYAGLVHEDKSLTPEAVAEIIDLDGLLPLLRAIMAAVSISMPRGKGEGGDPPKA